jgi:hypothetical protein
MPRYRMRSPPRRGQWPGGARGPGRELLALRWRGRAPEHDEAPRAAARYRKGRAEAGRSTASPDVVEVVQFRRRRPRRGRRGKNVAGQDVAGGCRAGVPAGQALNWWSGFKCARRPRSALCTSRRSGAIPPRMAQAVRSPEAGWRARYRPANRGRHRRVADGNLG